MSFFSGHRADWLRRAGSFSDSRWGLVVLALIAFADSSVLPLVPDLLLVPMLLLRPSRLLLLTASCIVASSAGALVGYAIGHLAWATFGETLVEMYGQADNFARYRQIVADWGVWIIIAKSFTPIPFKFIAIAAGLASMNLAVFTLAVVIGRTVHFAIIAILVALFGQRVLRLAAGYERVLVAFGLLTVVGLGIVWAVR